jgi:hypothetical protein
VLAIHPGEPYLAVQSITGTNVAARLAKALALPALRTWLEADCRFEVHGWWKKGRRGKRKLWVLTRRPVRLAELPRPERPLPNSVSGDRFSNVQPGGRIGAVT